jgi:spore coat polysaccharide biosynthesis protein SpsF
MSHPRTIAIIQARMSSSRLPGKVLLDIAGRPMLAHVVERTRRAASVDGVVVATSRDPSDEPIAAFCERNGYDCFRGSLHDVLDRYYQAAQAAQAQVIVRLTGDCPLIDPGVVEDTLRLFFGKPPEGKGISTRSNLPPASGPYPYDFAANRLPPPWGRTFPIGLDTEVCTFQALERAWREASQPYEREHVMPYLYMRSLETESQPGEQKGNTNTTLFRILLLNHDPDFGALRWTVDTPEDLQLVRRILAHFDGRLDFSWLEVLELFAAEPELALINAQVRHKNVHDFDARLLDQN